jgi:hypothetical protein
MDRFTGGIRRYGKVVAGAVAPFALSVAAHAQTAGAAVDYTALATAGKTEVVSAITQAAPVAMVVVAIGAGVGLVMSWLRRAAH